MASIKPFKAVVYNGKKIKDYADVVAPPYDIIPEKMQEWLHRKNPFNIVRLILGKAESGDDARNNRYIRASKFFESWLEDKIMVQDEKEALYVYSQKYRRGSKTIERTGFIGLLKLSSDKRKKALAHENTLAAPKQDRLNLMRSVKSNLSPIFVLYEDRPHKILNLLKKSCSKARPFVDIEFDKVVNRVWRLDDPATIKKIEDMMRAKDIFIADGHHRYEMALNYLAEVENSPLDEALKRNAKYMMAYFVESDEDMLTVLPAHRLIKDIGALRKEDIKNRLNKHFLIEKPKDIDSLESKLASLAGSSHAFGMYLGKGDLYILKMKDTKTSDKIIKNNSLVWKRLDVTILHLFILQHLLGIRDEDDNVEFVKDPEETSALVDSGKFKIAFFLNPTSVAQVKEIARRGEKMPRKATYFYPKPLSGLVINKLY